MKTIFLYGIGGADKKYKVLRYACIEEPNFSILNIRNLAQLMKIHNPSIVHVYALDNRFGLRRDYMESIKKDTIESCTIFKDILERDGWKVF